MTRIGVISDTHIPGKRKVIPGQVLEGLKGMDMIIHAGDINEDYVIYELEELAQVYAVAGNTDSDHMVRLLGKKKVISVEDCTIGVVHGDGTSGTTLWRARREFAEDAVDCIIYGHSHIPVNEMIDNILCFNPGSCTDKRRQKQFSYGILTVNSGNISGEIIYFD